MSWYWWILVVYGAGVVVVFIANFMMMIATGGMITFGLVVFRAVTWPLFWWKARDGRRLPMD